MSQSTDLKTGGIIFQKSDLRAILLEPDTLGIAFVLFQPGVADNVDLQVVKVKEENGNLVGEVRPIAAANKKAANSSFHYPAGVTPDFQFKYLTQLKSDGYYFGYMEKAVMLSLFSSEPKWTEVFVGGSKEDIPLPSSEKPDWFNFIVVLRQAIPATILNGQANTGNIYQFPALSGDKITAFDLAGADSNLLDLLEQKVENIFLDSNGEIPIGIKFENDIIGLFDSGTNITTITLNEDQKLQDLYTGLGLGDLSTEETNVLLGSKLPYYRRPLGCPPQWQMGNHGDSTEGDNLQEVINQALKASV